MIFWQLPTLLLALPVVITVEMLIAKLRYQVPLCENATGVSISNLTSTLVGIPLAWGTMLGLNILTTDTGGMGLDTPLGVFQSVVLQSSWLVPYREHLGWMIPAATIVLLVPYYFASVYSERLALRLCWRNQTKETVKRFSWMANTVTYACFFAYTCAWLAYAAIAG